MELGSFGALVGSPPLVAQEAQNSSFRAAVFRLTVFADSDGPPLALIARTTVFLA